MLISGVGSSGSVGPTSGGKTTPVNNVSNAAFAQVIAGNPNRVSITFVNPGTVDLYIGPMITATGAANSPNLSALGGTYPLFPGAVLTITGECQTAYGAIAASGTTNPLTVVESNV